MLYSTEAWTNISYREYERLEQVDMAAIRALVGGGHSKCSKAFYYLEFGIWMFRHAYNHDQEIKLSSSYHHKR